eukprot:COSAG06_NODE_2444_length_6866_cov_141.297769_5_plen_183_part_00
MFSTQPKNVSLNFKSIFLDVAECGAATSARLQQKNAIWHAAPFYSLGISQRSTTQHSTACLLSASERLLVAFAAWRKQWSDFVYAIMQSCNMLVFHPPHLALHSRKKRQGKAEQRKYDTRSRLKRDPLTSGSARLADPLSSSGRSRKQHASNAKEQPCLGQAQLCVGFRIIDESHFLVDQPD